MKIAVFFVGELHDQGFNASALAGAQNAKSAGLADISIISGICYDQELIRGRMVEIVQECDGLVFIGGQGNIVTPEIATGWPDKKFAIVQGEKTQSNLASYDVRQQDSAFLAGALAARITETGTVGHLSGHRVSPGLKGRAAFAAGVTYIDPSVRLLTGFCGTQDDADVADGWAAAEIGAGADILFTMLNAARSGAISACQRSAIKQIGNALDWVEINPELFVASAIARIDLGVGRAISDMAAGVTPAEVVHFGLAEGDFVSLSLGRSVSAAVAEEIADIAQRVRSRQITIPTEFNGAEFEPDFVR